MLHYAMISMLTAICTILLSSHQVSAFTLHFGTIAGESATVPGSENSDIPTPQLIRVAIDPSGATIGSIAPTDGYRTSGPALELRTPNMGPTTEPAAPQQQASPQAQKSTAAYQLSGSELLLLRKTSVVADRRAD